VSTAHCYQLLHHIGRSAGSPRTKGGAQNVHATPGYTESSVVLNRKLTNKKN